MRAARTTRCTAATSEVIGACAAGPGARRLRQPARDARLERAPRRRGSASWEQPWGEQRFIRDRHAELRVALIGADAAHTEPYDFTVRVFDDGIGFRYEFNAGSRHAATSPSSMSSPSSARGADIRRMVVSRRAIPIATNTSTSRAPPARSASRGDAADTAVAGTLYLSIHEAALVDYRQHDPRRTAERTLKADLMPWSDGVEGAQARAVRHAVAHDPGRRHARWRSPIRASLLNLNEPSQLADTSWIHPASTSASGGRCTSDTSTWGSGEKHGATTANMKRYIDFAAENGFDGVLVEGWNRGWDGDWIANGDIQLHRAYPGLRSRRSSPRTRANGRAPHRPPRDRRARSTNYERQLDAAIHALRRESACAW